MPPGNVSSPFGFEAHSHQDLQFASLPLLSIFSESPAYLQNGLSCFLLVQESGHRYVPRQPNAQFPCAAMTRKDIPVLHGATLGKGCTYRWGEEGNRGVSSRGTASPGLLLGSDRAAWDKNESAKRDGSYLLEGILAQPSSPSRQLWAAGVTHRSVCDCAGEQGHRRCGTELRAWAAVG